MKELENSTFQYFQIENFLNRVTNDAIENALIELYYSKLG